MVFHITIKASQLPHQFVIYMVEQAVVSIALFISGMRYFFLFQPPRIAAQYTHTHKHTPYTGYNTLSPHWHDTDTFKSPMRGGRLQVEPVLLHSVIHVITTVGLSCKIATLLIALLSLPGIGLLSDNQLTVVENGGSSTQRDPRVPTAAPYIRHGADRTPRQKRGAGEATGSAAPLFRVAYIGW